MATKLENGDENVENGDKQINSNDLTGGFGRWQMNITIFYFVAYILTTINNLGYVFQAANTDYHCVHPIIISTTTAVDSFTINKDLDSLYTNTFSTISNFSSTPITSKFGLICGKEWLRSFAQSMYQLGYVFSGIIIAWISDHCGRKFALQISIAFELLGGLLLILSPSIHLYTLARLILGFGDSGRGMCLYMLLMETVGTKRRSDVIMGCNFGWIVGYLLLPILAYILHNYVLVQLVATLGMTVMALFWLPYLPESPRWLLANEKYERAKSVLKEACKRNNRVEVVKEFEYKFESLKNKASKLITTGKAVEEQEQEQSDSEKFMTLWSMVTNKKYCMMTLILWFSFFVNGFIYHGFSLNVEIIGGNIFINFALAGLVEIPSVVISLIGMRYIGRKAFIISTIVSAASCYATIAIFRLLCDDLSENDILLISLSMLGKMFIFATFNAIYIHAGEIFPTKLRQSGVSSCSISARAGSTIAPFVKDLTMSFGLTNTIIMFTVLSLTAAIGTFFLPETKDRDLIDNID
ncbi:organic cation transporter protein-like protein [Dermatophagoides farinae]|uniref:Organic cation transporter protein-like protein n=1 Tax=Dermatophagoides farinae TaxID=6954 RepID=A0A9D4SHF0_DERFA|nr:organic cation transporter protein-like protein [Dermatophagoides farinae]